MTDELYDYFGGNASKKVEPIEDDELESTEDESIGDTGELKAERGSLQNEPTQSTDSESQPVEKKTGHWDFLANMLGVGPAKSESQAKSETKTASGSASRPDADQVSDPPQAATDSVKKAVAEESGDGDFMGFKSIPSPEEATPLPSMFSSTSESKDPQTANEANDLIGWDPGPTKPAEIVPSTSETEPVSSDSFAAPESEESSEVHLLEFEFDDDTDFQECDEFVEFEIEELDDSPLDEGDAIAHGRRPRRRKPIADVTRKQSGEQARGRGQTSGGSQRKQPQENDGGSRGRSHRSRRGRGDRDRPAPRGEYDRDASYAKPSNEFSDVRDELDQSTSSDRSRAERSEGSITGRKRRRRRGSRSRTDRDRTEESSEIEENTRFGAGIHDDPGFESNRQSTDAFEDDFEIELDEVESELNDEASDSEDSNRNEDDRPRRRKRSRGRGRARGRQPAKTADVAHRVEDDEDQNDSEPRNERRRAKVPTWDETIAVLIESNIRNHKKSGNSRRGGGRSGNRGGEGGGSRGGGNRGGRSGGGRSSGGRR